MATLEGSDSVMRALEDIARNMGGGHVDVGFMAEARYPDGTPVAAVAFWNEFGHGGKYPSPPRPFFRRMIAKDSPDWPEQMADQARKTNYDGQLVLDRMGESIVGQLKKSINDLTSPKLAQSTIDAKGFPKPLIETRQMIDRVTHVVSP